MKQKFNKGDKVRIKGYGHLGWYSDIESLNEFKNFEAKTDKDFVDLLIWGKEITKNVPSEMPNKDYSHLVLAQFEGVIIDETPSIVGKEGIIEGSYADLYKSNQERDHKIYSIQGIPGKSAWYDEVQLELV